MRRAATAMWSRRRLVLVTAVIALALAGAAHGVEGASQAPWAGHVAAVDAALAQGNLRVAERALYDAYTAALGSRSWEGMADVGDAYRRVGEASGGRRRAEARARESYLAALFRARQQGSLPGVFRLAEAFSTLGHREVVNMCIQIAKGLASQVADAKEREQAQASVERVGRRLLALESPKPE